MNEELYELTNPQKSIWLTEQYYPNTNINNISGIVKIFQNVDFNVLKQAINNFIQLNDSYKIKLKLVDGSILQYFDDYRYFDFDVKILKSEEELDYLDQTICEEKFDMFDSFLFKFTLFKLPNGHGGFVVKTHHIISDSWSLGITVNRIMDIYSSLLCNNSLNQIDSTTYSYKDFICAEKKYLSSEKYNKDKDYWLNLFNTIPDIATIPYTLKNSNIDDSIEAKRLLFTLDEILLEKINQFCTNKKVSVYNFFMSVFALYLCRVSNLEDIVIGTPILNRTKFNEKQTTGMFINTLPLRIISSDTLSFGSFLTNIATNSMSLLRHQKYLYQNILEELRKTTPSLLGLYNVMLSYQVTKIDENMESIPHCSKWKFNNTLSNDLDIHIFDLNNAGALNIAYDYKTSKYKKSDMESVHNRICYIIEQVLSSETLLLKDIEVVTNEEKQKLLYEFNDTKLDYNKNNTIHKLFEEQAKRTPNNIALVFENNNLTYKQLNEKANCLADYLRKKKNISRNTFVGVMVNRSFEMIIGILAILKAGGTYVPIDPEYPKDRIEYMLTNCDAKLLLVSNKTYPLVSDIEKIKIDLEKNSIYENSNFSNLENISSSSDLMYTIYTSGSTGKPKGVMLTHKNIVNYILGLTNIIDFSENKTMVSVTTICFDIFVTEVWASLLNGLKVILANEDEQNIPQKLNKLCLKNNVNMIQTTPSRFNLILKDTESCNFLNNISDLMIGGEALSSTVLEILNEFKNLTVFNMYGPTETAVWSTIKILPKIDNITIGKPIANTFTYILDKNLHLLPPYSVGELYIGGDGVSNGYLNRKNLTLKNFINSPFDNSTLYNTNDLAYIKEDGELVHLGRSDFQVKIHGFRIEIGEIESVLLSYPSISDAVVIYQDDNLNAFYVTDKDINTDELLSFMLKFLPHYMIPKHMKKLDSIPLTPNGKVDRKNSIFKNIRFYDDSKSIIIPATTELEKNILSVVCDVLNVDIGITQNIFNYGADSLAIIKIITILYNNNIQFTVQDFYNHPSVELLCQKTESKVLENISIVEDENLVKNISSIKAPINYKSHSDSILITGANGFLGVHLLAELLESSNKKIYCLMREKNSTNVKARLLKTLHYYFSTKYDSMMDSRVTVINSNIINENFGLSEELYNKIGNDVTCVIHSAADVRHFGNYKLSEKVNILSTKNVISFCKTFNVVMHHMSTLTVSGYGLVDIPVEKISFAENEFYIGQKYNDNIYVKTKFESELEIFKEVKNGLICNIYRLGNLTNRFKDYKVQRNSRENAFLNRLRLIKITQQFPDSIKNMKLEITPVDYCASAIIKLALELPIKYNLSIYHIYNDNTVDVPYLLDAFGKSNKPISFIDSKSFIKTAINNSNIKSYELSGFINESFDNVLSESNNDFFSNTNTINFLNDLNFSWPEIDLNYLKSIIENLDKENEE